MFSTTGKKVTITTTAALDSQSTPNARPSTGARPTMGTAPKALASGRNPCLRNGLNDIATPARKPALTPMARPSATSWTKVT